MDIDRIDEKIKNIASSQKLHLPDTYDEMVKSKTAQMEIRCSRKHHLPKTAVAAIVALIALCGSVGVYAARNYLAEHMATVSETEQQEYIEEVSEAEVHADSFSRKFTENEDVRMQELAEAYQTEGKFPEGEVVRIASEEEILPDRVCFMPDTSTFYLPETEMTDEDLLEIIDFYCKRDYSIMEQEREDIEYSVDYEMDHDVALEKAEELIARVFGVDPETCEVSTEYHMGTYGIEDFSELYVTVTTDDNVCYFTYIDLQSGKISSIEVWYEDANNVENISINEDFSVIIDKARQIAISYNDEFADAEDSILYYTNKDGYLENGMLFIFFETEENTVLIKYSCVVNNIVEIRMKEREYFERWKPDITNKWKQLGFTVHEFHSKQEEKYE